MKTYIVSMLVQVMEHFVDSAAEIPRRITEGHTTTIQNLWVWTPVVLQAESKQHAEASGKIVAMNTHGADVKSVRVVDMPPATS